MSNYFGSKMSVASNVLDRDFIAGCPDEKWTIDYLYPRLRRISIPSGCNGPLLQRRSWDTSMKQRLTQELFIEVMNMAIRTRRPLPGLIVHTDRGSQYGSFAYRQLLEKEGYICSMSRKGNYW